MRLRILKDFVSPQGLYKAGQVVDISEPLASEWLKGGLAMEDKSLDGAREIKRKTLKGWPKTNRIYPKN